MSEASRKSTLATYLRLKLSQNRSQQLQLQSPLLQSYYVRATCSHQPIQTLAEEYVCVRKGTLQGRIQWKVESAMG